MRVPGLDRNAVQRIEAGYEVLERLAAEIDQVARRRHTGGLVIVLLRSLLEHLADWYVTIEHSLRRRPVALLPRDVRLMLEELPAGVLTGT
jgi:hypothetical protein